MNYRHIYHAGNFADVVKHAVLALVIERLKLKEAPFRVIDTHAGIGLYDLGSDAARRTGEWRGGIGRLLGPDAAPLPAPAAALLSPYLDAVRSFNRGPLVERYPGSPHLARALMRPQDMLVANELHPDDAATLRESFARDRQTKVLELDGWTALKSLLPPRERRGVVLVDPPFEEQGEFRRLVDGLGEAVRRFATGTYLLWYPIKDEAPIHRFKRELEAMALPKLMTAQVLVRAPAVPEMLVGCGLAILNPPFRLDEQLDVLLPFLATRLAIAPGARARVEWHGKDDRKAH